MTSEYLTNDVDVLISRYIELEKQKNDISDNEYSNTRDSFYDLLNKTSKDIKKRANVFYPWSRLFDETLFIIYKLHKTYFLQEKTKTPAMLLHYIFKLQNSMKILFNSGYFEQGLIIYRTIIENIHVELISITDLEFSKMLIDENEDPNVFWNKNISKGKITTRINKVLDEIKINKENIIPTKDVFSYLCEFVHASTGTPMMMVEALMLRPHLIETEPFGVLNFHSINAYVRIIQNNLEFISANIRLILNDKTWFEDIATWGNDINNIIIDQNAVSKCLRECYLPQFNNEKLWNIDNFMKDE